jgi:hypothetical protein
MDEAFEMGERQEAKEGEAHDEPPASLVGERKASS